MCSGSMSQSFIERCRISFAGLPKTFRVLGSGLMMYRWVTSSISAIYLSQGLLISEFDHLPVNDSRLAESAGSVHTGREPGMRFSGSSHVFRLPIQKLQDCAGIGALSKPRSKKKTHNIEFAVCRICLNKIVKSVEPTGMDKVP